MSSPQVAWELLAIRCFFGMASARLQHGQRSQFALGKWLADCRHGADLSETCVMDYSWAEPYLNYSVVYEENVVKLAPGV